MAWPGRLLTNNIPPSAHHQSLVWYPRICAVVATVSEHAFPGLPPVESTPAAHQKSLHRLGLIFGIVALAWGLCCQVASAILAAVTNTRLYARMKLSIYQFCRYAYIFVHFLQLYTTWSERANSGHGAFGHWFAPGTEIRHHLKLKSRELGVTEQRLAVVYWTNKLRLYYRSWNWRETKRWLRSWTKKPGKRPKKVLAKPPPGSHLRKKPFTPSLLTTVDEYDEREAMPVDQPAVQVKKNTANGAANKKKKRKKKRR